MKLSIIIPTYNSGAVIDRALKSILAQTFTDWEVLIMDGLSTDDTVSIAESFNDPRIHVYSEPDKGIYDAMNKGIKKAQGEWLYFLGSDDWLLNDNVLAEVFSKDIGTYDVVYGEAEFDHLCDSFRGEWTQQNLFVNRCHQAIFYKKQFLTEIGGYELRYKIYADFDLNLKWLFSKNYRNKYIATPIAHFSAAGTSDGKMDELFCKHQPKIYLKHGWHMMNREQRAQCAYAAKHASKGVARWAYGCLLIILRAINKIHSLLC